MKLPAIIVNFKIYEQGVGLRALELAKLHQRVGEETGASIAVAVNAVDLRAVAESVSIPVFAQHVDCMSFGSSTGWISADMIKDAGAYGTLINHAEHQVEDEEDLNLAVERAKRAGLFVVACANTPERAKEILEHNPDMIAVEPPDLIGGDVSISKAGPALIEEAVKVIGGERTLVGAGIQDKEDVEIAVAKGASGVLVASSVVKAEDPYKALLELVSGLG